MWDLFKGISRGRLSARRFSLFATSLIVAIFATTTVFIAPTVAAVDAVRDGDSINYDGKTFSPAPNNLLPAIPGVANLDGYIYQDTANNKTYFILTSGDKTKATSGNYAIYSGQDPGTYKADGTPVSVSIVGAAGASAGTSTCANPAFDGIGWIVCPITRALAGLMDTLYTLLQSFLVVRPLQSNMESPAFKMWAIIRDIANVCFVIAFLVVVYSLITQQGISNYSLKKMIPRFVIAAGLVNVSFWICALAVDASNVIGYSIYDVMMGVYREFLETGNYSQVTWTWITNFILSGGLIAGGASMWAAGFFSLEGLRAGGFLLVVALAGVVLAALIALIVLAARQALIMILIVISPLAFVAYVLPNTEKYFEKWLKSLATLLFMFPAFSVIFAGAQLAGLIIILGAKGNSVLALAQIIFGLFVQVAPVVITPLLARFSGSLLGRILNVVNSPKKGLIDRTKNWANPRRDREMARLRAGEGRRIPGRVPVIGGKQLMNGRAVKRDQNRRRIEKYKSRYDQMAGDMSDRDWSRDMRTDSRLLSGEVSARRVNQQAEEEKAKLGTLHSELGAVGSQHRSIQAMQSQLAPDLYARTAASADTLRTSTDEIAYTGMSKSLAERESSGNRAAALKAQDASGAALRGRVSGVMTGKGGEASIEAQARRTSSKFVADDIENIQATLDNELATNPDWLLNQLTNNRDITFTQRVAYTNILTKSGGPGIDRIKVALSDYENKVLASTGSIAGNTEIHEELQDYKDFMRGNSSFTGAGKDLEFWATNNRDRNGNIQTFDNITKGRGTWSNISTENITTFNAASQFRMLNVLYHENREAYDKHIAALHDNDNMLYNRMKQGVQNKITAVENGTDVWEPIPADTMDTVARLI